MHDDKIDSNWIFISPGALEKRERKNVEFLRGSSDPEKMFQNFMARSLWYNGLFKKEAEEFGMTVIQQEGETAVDVLCDAILAKRKKG